MKQSRSYFIAAGILIFADQLSKFLVKGGSFLGISHDGMYLGQSVPVIGDVVRFTFVENPGMAFGISWGSLKIVLTCITIAIAAVLGYMVHSRQSASKVERISFTLLFAGAVGNLIDRLLYGVLYGEGPLFEGKVVDFIQVDIPDVLFNEVHYTHWPVFNIADSCVTIGVLLMLVVAFRTPKSNVKHSEHEHA